MTGVIHEVYAVKFGVNAHGTRGRYFLGDAGRPADEPVPLDYFVWVLRSPLGDIVVDTGWTPETSKGRPRTFLETSGAALRRIGVDPSVVELVVLTHFHNDHVGDVDGFPRAVFVAQRSEYEFWTSGEPWSEHGAHAERDDVARIVALNALGRVRLMDGDAELADGLRVVALGGHTPGSQVVVADTRRGPVVIAGDAVHYYAEVEDGADFAFSTDLREARRSVARVRELASGGVVVPGHDPEVLTRFDAVPGHEHRVARVA